MPIDNSMYSNMRGLDLGAARQEGMKMSDMIKQRRDQEAQREAYKAGAVVGPDGKTTFDPSLTASALAKGGFGKEANELTRQADEDKRKKTQHSWEDYQKFGQIAYSAQSQEDWDRALGTAKQMGADVSQISPVFDPKLRDNIAGGLLTYADKMKLESDAKNRAEARAERAYLRGESRQDRLDARAEKLYERDQALATPFGKANTPDDAKQLKEAFEAKRNFDSKLNDMISLRKEHGGEILDREAVARGKQLSKDLLLEYKNMAKLGVLSQADEKIINAIIPDDPLAYRSPLAAIQGQDPILSNLEKFKADKDQDFQTRVGTRTRAGVGSVANQSPQQSSQSQVQAPRQGEAVDGYVFMGGDPSDPKSWKPATSTSVARAKRKD